MKPSKPKKFKIPSKLGACADLLVTLRAERMEIQKQADEIEEQEKAIKMHLIEKLPVEAAEGVVGELATVRVIEKIVPTVEDWEKVQGYIVKHGAWDMLQRRTNAKAFTDRWEAGEVIPGTSKFHVKDLSVRNR